MSHTTSQNVARAKLLRQRVLNLQQIPAIVRGYDYRHQTLNYRQLPLRRRRALLQKMEWAGAQAEGRTYECVGSKPLQEQHATTRDNTQQHTHATSAAASGEPPPVCSSKVAAAEQCTCDARDVLRQLVRVQQRSINTHNNARACTRVHTRLLYATAQSSFTRTYRSVLWFHNRHLQGVPSV